MKKIISIVRKGLVIDVGRFEKSDLKGWLKLYSRDGEMIGGLSLMDNKLQVIHKNKIDDTLFITYSIRDRGEVI